MRTDYVDLAFVTVTFNPDISVLSEQLKVLPSESSKVIVDNASEFAIASTLEDLAGRFENTVLLRNESNLGLAAAINLGVRTLSSRTSPPKWVLMLDQDSEPLPGSIPALIEAYRMLEAAGNKVGCVGPTLLDNVTQLTHGFHQCTRWRWKRVYPSTDSVNPIACANLNGSGTLTSIDLFQELGGLDESLFIDHVDTEWSFRVSASGHGLWGVPNAVFVHRMGQESTRFWLFGWWIWPKRSPKRHYFLFRNAVLLMGRSYVPRIWKAWAAVKLVITLLFTAIIGPDRRLQLKNMFKGSKDGCQMLWRSNLQ